MKMWRTLYKERLAKARLELVAITDWLLIQENFLIFCMSWAEVLWCHGAVVLCNQLKINYRHTVLAPAPTPGPRLRAGQLGQFQRKFKYFSRKPFVQTDNKMLAILPTKHFTKVCCLPFLSLLFAVKWFRMLCNPVTSVCCELQFLLLQPH